MVSCVPLKRRGLLTNEMYIVIFQTTVVLFMVKCFKIRDEIWNIYDLERNLDAFLPERRTVLSINKSYRESKQAGFKSD